MRIEMIKAKIRSEAIAAAPWAAKVVKIGGGYYRCFETMQAYEQAVI